MEFPYRETFIETDPKVNLKTIRSYKPCTIKQDKAERLKAKKKFKGKYVVFLDSYEKYGHINNITDVYSEKCRINCIFYKQYISPFEYFENNRDELIEKTKKGGKLTNERLRETIYKGLKECTLFNITVVMNILKMFKPKSWLDISAGWGDRLIGAIAYDIDYYCGVDPNPCMQPIYKRIIDEMATKKEKIKIIEGPFEKVKLPKKMFDIVFTSPPFFDIEIYTKDNSQSIEKYKEYDEWMDNFMLSSIKKAWKRLKKGKYMLLYIPNRYRDKEFFSVIDRYIIDKLKGVNAGIIYYYTQDAKRLRNIDVWKKIK
jgi:16S rRNA G966 N2-methylase RsmD